MKAQHKKHSFVTISGLQSKAGAELNHSIGIVLGSPNASNKSDVLRYPIQVCWSREKDRCLQLSELRKFKKNIKPENLTPLVLPDEEPQKQQQRGEMLAQWVINHFLGAYQDRRRRPKPDWKGLCFWLQVYHTNWPNDSIRAMQYAESLVEIGKPKKAVQIADKMMDATIPDDGSEEDYFLHCRNIATIFTKAGVRLDEALEWALKIPYDFVMEDKGQKVLLCHDALDQLAVLCQGICDKDIHPMLRPDIRDIYLKCCQVPVDNEPENMSYVWNLALANYACENYLEAVKLFRKAQASGTLSLDKALGVQSLLPIAQLFLPGMPLHGYKMICLLNYMQEVWALRTEYLNKCRFTRDYQPNGGFRPGISSTIPPANLQAMQKRVPVPKDSDDRSVWPAALFELLQKELKEGSPEYQALFGSSHMDSGRVFQW